MTHIVTVGTSVWPEGLCVIWRDVSRTLCVRNGDFSGFDHSFIQKSKDAWLIVACGGMEALSDGKSQKFFVSLRNQGQITVALEVRFDGLETWRQHV